MRGKTSGETESGLAGIHVCNLLQHLLSCQELFERSSTSSTVVPLPFAIRFRRLPLIKLWFARSLCVMENPRSLRFAPALFHLRSCSSWQQRLHPEAFPESD